MCNKLIFSKYRQIGYKQINCINILYIYFSLFIIISSCQQKLDLEIKTNDKRLLVNGEFTNDSIIHSIKLYCSGSLITGRPQKTISKAKIFVTDKIDTFYYIESSDTPGLYQTLKKCRGIIEHTYYLNISNIDVDNNGKLESYSAKCFMPIPIELYEMKSKRDTLENGDPGGAPAIFIYVYFKMLFNGPDYVNMQINHKGVYEIKNWIEYNQGYNVTSLPKISNQNSIKTDRILIYLFTEPFGRKDTIVNGDTIICNCLNLMKNEYDFLNDLSNNSNYDWFRNNYYDQLKIPTNLPTNIEPSDKAAGFFFVYSVSRISKVFTE